MRFVVPDRPFRLADVNFPQFLAAQNLRIGGDKSSTKAGDGTGSVPVNIAIIDSGIDGTIPDLNSHAGVDCSSGKPKNPGRRPTDRHGHGTFVAGVAAAPDNAIGIVGAAPGAPVWSATVVDNMGQLSLATMVCAVDWVTSTRRDKDPANDIRAANMSVLGDGMPDDGNCGRTNGDPLHLAICASVAAGVTYVVAAGNEGQAFSSLVPPVS